MKTIITTVGTSVFTNLIKDGQNSEINDIFNDLKDRRFSEWSNYESSIEDGKGNRKGLRSLTKKAIANHANDSAEIKSIIKIAKDEPVIVHLLATDSILSVLAAEIIKDWFQNKQATKFNNSYQQDVIQDLQVESIKDFKQGLTNLVTRFYVIVGKYFEPKEFVLNITGGYKALIPFMTILGQVNRIDIRYIFEDTEGVLEIPRLPLKRDNELFEKYLEVFQTIDDKVELNTAEYYQFSQDAESCLEFYQNGKTFCLNSLGLIFWEDYRKQFYNFFCPDDVWLEMQNQHEILRILGSKFHFNNSKIGPKLTHKTVYDDGRNTYRIFFFKVDDNVYIYKSFEEYSVYDNYWRTIEFDDNLRQTIIRNSKQRKIKIS